MNIEYAAGLFDGEGCVRIARWEKPQSAHVRYQVIGYVGMTHRPVIEMLLTEFGGSMSVNDHSRRNPKHKPQFCWHVASQTACAFFRNILPHLIVKRDQVELALELQADIDEHRHTLGNRYWLHIDHPAIMARRDVLYRQISEFKSQRYSPLLDSDAIGVSG